MRNVNLHPSKRTHWVAYSGQNLFDSYGCPQPKTFPDYKKCENGKCNYSEKRVPKIDNLCASYVLYIIHSTKVLGVDSASTGLN